MDKEKMIEKIINADETVKIAFFAVMLADTMSDDSTFFDDYSVEEMIAAAAYLRENIHKIPADSLEWFAAGAGILDKEIAKRK